MTFHPRQVPPEQHHTEYCKKKYFRKSRVLGKLEEGTGRQCSSFRSYSMSEVFPSSPFHTTGGCQRNYTNALK